LKIRKFFLPVLMLLVILGLAACGSQNNGTVQELVPVARGDLTVTVNGSGNLETVKNRRLSFSSAGQVSEIYVKEGQTVAKDDRLVSLDTKTLELGVSQAEVAYDQAKLAVTQADVALKSAELALNQALDRITVTEVQAAQDDVDKDRAYLQYVTTRMIDAPPEEKSSWTAAFTFAQAQLAASQAKLDAMLTHADTEEVALARLQVTSAQQAYDLATKSQPLAEQTLNEARRQLDAATLKAPFDGIVARINVTAGDIASPAVPAVEIIDPANMQFEIQVDEIDVVSVQPGQKVNIEVDALPELKLEGEVNFIYDLPSVQTGVVAYSTRISLQVPENVGLKVGMSASADIVTAERANVLLVPDRAISKNDKGENIVTVHVNGVNETRVIVTGITDGIRTEIIDGLKEGETVVVERTSQSMGGLF
jgi:HlyD family secretion protein